ncbi:uncharacterized protein LOC144444445 isoform X2 [Glandiceps talaboti]
MGHMGHTIMNLADMIITSEEEFGDVYWIDVYNDKCRITFYQGAFADNIFSHDNYGRNTITGEILTMKSDLLKFEDELPEKAKIHLDLERLRKDYDFLGVVSFVILRRYADTPNNWNFYSRDLSEDVQYYLPDISFDVVGCPPGKFGIMCQDDCVCQNGATCHTFNGACKCTEGWKGVACDIAAPIILVSPTNVSLTYGQYFVVSCDVINVEFIIADSANFLFLVNGKEVNLYYVFVQVGPKKYKGNLEISTASEMNTGEITCQYTDHDGDIFTAAAQVNISGCSKDYWGESCSELCQCVNDATCDRYSGCICAEGWTGQNCTKICSQGWYGSDCNQECRCENGAHCDRRDGTCSCTGESCGRYCQDTCTCEHPMETPKCNASNVCICQEVSERPHTNGNYFTTWSTTGVVFTIAIITIGVLIYARFKMKNNKYKKLGAIDVEVENMITVLREKVKDFEVPRSRLKIERGAVLGQGEYGHVVKAQLQTCRGTTTVAVKRINEDKAHYYNHRDFCREVETLISVKGHQNIIEFHGVVLNEEPRYIIVEYAGNGDLLNYAIRLRRRHVVPLEEEQRLIQFARDVTHAMAFLREKKIVHRDVAARNVLITDEYVAKIGDFGLSRNVFGTKGRYEKVPWAADQGPLPLKWMPVEFLTKGIYKTEGDIWSFGVLLWELASLGETPFQHVPALEFYRRLASGERLEKPRRCSKAAYAIMRHCWQSPLQLRPDPNKLTEMLNDLLRSEEMLFIRNAEARHYPNSIV